MSLDLGRKRGIATGYPQLIFSQFKDQFILRVNIQSNYPGYDEARDITLEEMITFVLVAKKVAPEERMTQELVKKVTQLLTSKRDKINSAIELIS